MTAVYRGCANIDLSAVERSEYSSGILSRLRSTRGEQGISSQYCGHTDRDAKAMGERVWFNVPPDTIIYIIGHFGQWRRYEFESAGGGTDWAKSAGKILVVPLHFLAIKVQIG